MTLQNAIKLFEQKQVRSVWDDNTEEWYFSIVDVVAVLTDSNNPQVYWRLLKKRLLAEKNQKDCCKTSNGINNSLFLTFECKTRRTTEKIQHFLKFSDLFESLLKPPV